MAGKHILIGTLTTLIAPFEPSIGVVEAVCLNLLKFTKKYINIPSEKYIYVHKYVYICVYTYLCKMDERRSFAGLS